LLASVVEESMRLEPAAASVHRYATRDTEKFGARIRAGDFVDVSLSAANRDPEVFPQPDKLDPGRPNLRRHVTFAHGPHACLGIHLARLETTLGVQAVLEGLPSVTLVNGADVAPRGLVFRKPPAVQVCW
jgi:cytochrome P450